ncbi:MAG: DUF4347 domain-containing protein, partial [Methylococcaceae bacterium]
MTTPNEIVFIDRRVQDYDVLQAGIAPGVEVHIIESDRDGLQQIIDALAGRSGLEAVHIISHGSSGQLQLGSTLLDSAQLEAHRNQWATLGQSLTAEGDVLLYGCDVAQGDSGQAFVQKIASLTGADVAASDDITGKHGDWNLEYTTGTITASSGFDPALLDSYQGDLSITVGTTGSASIEASSLNGVFYFRAPHWDAYNDGPGAGWFGTTFQLAFRGSYIGVNGALEQIQGVYNFPRYMGTSGHFWADGALVNPLTYPGGQLFNAPSSGTISITSWTLGNDYNGIYYSENVNLSTKITVDILPQFLTGSTQALSYTTTDTVTYDLKSYLHISDKDTGQTETWTQITAPAHGTLSIGGATATSGSTDIAPPDGSITYTPTGGYSGADTFTIQVSDGSQTTTKTFNVLYNDTPIITASGNPLAYTEQTPVAVDSGMVISDTADTEWNGGTLAVQITAHSETTDTLFLPTTASADIWLNTSGNQLMSGTTQIGTANTAQVTGNTTWTFTFNSAATNNRVQGVARAIQFDDKSDSPSTAVRTVTFTATDKYNASTSTAAATQSIGITPVNDAPVGVNDTATAVEAGGYLNATAGTDPTGNVLTNDTDPDAGDTKTVSDLTGGTVGTARAGKYGSLNLKADGSYTYSVNNANFYVNALRTSANTLTDTFTYTVKDGGGLTSTATLTVTVQGANDAPLAVNDTATAVEAGGSANATAGINPTGNVLTNDDNDVDTGDTSTVSALTGGTLGTALAGQYGGLNLKADGSYTYTVDNANSTVQALRLATDTVTDTFTYTMKDTAGLTSTATLTVTVQGANDTPIGVNDTATAVEAGGSLNATAGT